MKASLVYKAFQANQGYILRYCLKKTKQQQELIYLINFKNKVWGCSLMVALMSRLDTAPGSGPSKYKTKINNNNK